MGMSSLFTTFVCVCVCVCETREDTCSANQPMCLSVQCVCWRLGLLKKELIWSIFCWQQGSKHLSEWPWTRSEQRPVFTPQHPQCACRPESEAQQPETTQIPENIPHRALRLQVTSHALHNQYFLKVISEKFVTSWIYNIILALLFLKISKAFLCIYNTYIIIIIIIGRYCSNCNIMISLC